jgi:hypothetical protein
MSNDSPSPNLYAKGLLCNAAAGAAAGMSISSKPPFVLCFLQFSAVIVLFIGKPPFWSLKV